MNMDKTEVLAEIRKNAFEIVVEVLDGGKMPAKAHATDAGWDLYATEDITIYPGQVKKHPLNIRMQLPKGTWAEITSKSGLGAKGLLVYAGVIDESYRGIPHVVFSNIWVIDSVDPADGFPLMRTTPIVIKKGEKLAQMILNSYSDQYYMVEGKVDTITERGEAGFGSSGK
jgi:dUTP pyrophosphatase